MEQDTYSMHQQNKDSIINTVKDLGRDKAGYCLLVRGEEKRIYLIHYDSIELVFDVSIGQNGLGKTVEGDKKTPLGDYTIKWMVSRKGPQKENPGGLSSYVKDGETYAVLSTELYFGDVTNIRVKDLPGGVRVVSKDPKDRLITPGEIEIAQTEKLWTDSYGGQEVFVMALDYPNENDRKEGKTGSCIEIHASAELERTSHKTYRGTYGCISLYPSLAGKIYSKVNPGTPVRIIR